MTIPNERLTSFIRRIEALEAEKAELAGDIKEVFAEVKASGYDVKVVRALLRERKMDPADLAEQKALLETYRAAVGMLADTPLGKAMERFVDGVPKDSSVTISAGDTSVTIAKDKDGRVSRGVKA